MAKKAAVFLVVAGIILVAYMQFGDLLSLESLAKQEGELRAFQAENPFLVFGVAFLVYVLATGFSLPGAAILTLAYGWYFGCLLYTSPSPRDQRGSRMPSSA